MSDNAIRTLIVDDESPARNGLRVLVGAHPGFTVIGEAADGEAAVEQIRSLNPDLVLLDVQMPGMNGLEVVAKIGPEAMPAVIFVTAYDEYAVTAFDAHAVDYVLKPVVDERLVKALERARRALANDAILRLQSLKGMLANVTDLDLGRGPERFTVKVGDSIRAFRMEEIDWIEADEYYVKLHIGGKAYLVRQTMHVLEEQLPSQQFVRIHRSAIVNIDRIQSFEPLFRGEYTVMLKDGTKLRMSRRRSELLVQRFHSLT